MKIGIFTFQCAINYGAVLQAFALKEYLKSLGHEVHVIDYRPDYLLSQYKPFQLSKYPHMDFMTKLKMSFRECLFIPIRLIRKRNFSKFNQSYLDLDNLNLYKEKNDYDAFIFGSDQIWNEKITKGIDETFWGVFPAAKNKRLISYAASAGSVDFLIKDEKSLRERLNRFSSISVRELSLLNFISNNFNTAATLVLDPVLMAGADCFKKISSEPVKKPYLLLFQLINNDKVRNIAKIIAREKGLEIIEILSMQETFRNGVKMSLSPEKFLTMLRNADFVVTPSFHGTAFSILFKRNFVTIGVEKKNDERSKNMLKSLGLESRYVYDVDDIVLDNIQYNLVDQKFKELQQHSRDFLNTALNKDI